jgi:very-short-patch-repair endonuclease
MNTQMIKPTSGVIQLQRVTEYKIEQARALRKNMTLAEELLWSKVRGKRCGNLKFRRQQIIDGFIADFFCASASLVVEVDGQIHDNEEQKKIDEHRREVFNARGLREIRFRNEEVLNDIETVLERIEVESTSTTPPRPPATPPRIGEGK